MDHPGCAQHGLGETSYALCNTLCFIHLTVSELHYEVCFAAQMFDALPSLCSCHVFWPKAWSDDLGSGTTACKNEIGVETCFFL